MYRITVQQEQEFVNPLYSSLLTIHYSLPKDSSLHSSNIAPKCLFPRR
jgi:hypothetical protein